MAACLHLPMAVPPVHRHDLAVAVPQIAFGASLHITNRGKSWMGKKRQVSRLEPVKPSRKTSSTPEWGRGRQMHRRLIMIALPMASALTFQQIVPKKSIFPYHDKGLAEKQLSWECWWDRIYLPAGLVKSLDLTFRYLTAFIHMTVTQTWSKGKVGNFLATASLCLCHQLFSKRIPHTVCNIKLILTPPATLVIYTLKQQNRQCHCMLHKYKARHQSSQVQPTGTTNVMGEKTNQLTHSKPNKKQPIRT